MNNIFFTLIFIIGLMFSLFLTGLVCFGILTSKLDINLSTILLFVMPSVALILSYFKIFRNKGNINE